MRVSFRIAAGLGFAAATVVALLFSVPGAAQNDGMAMPANCRQDLDLCSEKVWPHDSFPHIGVQRSVTFSDGATLTCTSEGADRPRDCSITPEQSTASPCAAIRDASEQAERDLLVAQTVELRAGADLRDAQRRAQALANLVATRDPDQLDQLVKRTNDMLATASPDARPALRAMLAYLVEMQYLGKSDPAPVIGDSQKDVANAQKTLDQIRADTPSLERNADFLQARLKDCEAK